MSPEATGPLPSDVEVEAQAVAAHPASDPRAASRATAAMLASRLVIAALGWAGSVIIARTLSPDDWGSYSFVFALLGLMAIFTDLGVGRAVMAELISSDIDDVAKTSSAFIALRTVLGLIGYLIAVLYVVVLQYPGEIIRATAAAGLVIVFATPAQALTVIFQSRHRLVLTAVAESLGQVLQLALTIAAALAAPVLLIFVLAPVANEILALTLKVVAIARRSSDLRPSRVIEWSRWKPMLTDALPLAIGFALTIALLKIDMLLLSLLDTLDAVGIYGIGYKFSDIMDTLILAAVGPISTLLVAAWPQHPAVLRQRCRTAAVAFGAGGAVAVAAFWPSAEKVIKLLYGERFAVGADAARLLVLGAALMALIVLGIYLLASTGYARMYPPIAIGGLIINVALNLVLIPEYSYNGAAVATVITLVVVVVALWILIARALPVIGLFPLGALTVLGVLCALVCVLGVQVVGIIPWPVVSAVAALIVAAPAVMLIRRVGSAPGRHMKVTR